MIAMLFAAIALATASPQDGAGSEPLELKLECGGVTSQATSSTSRGSVYGTGGSYSGSATTYGSTSYDETVGLEFDGDSGRIRMRGVSTRDGWARLRNIIVTPEYIEADFTLNYLTRPKIHVDRISGEVRIDAYLADFTGVCDAVEPNEEPRF